MHTNNVCHRVIGEHRAITCEYTTYSARVFATVWRAAGAITWTSNNHNTTDMGVSTV